MVQNDFDEKEFMLSKVLKQIISYGQVLVQFFGCVQRRLVKPIKFCVCRSMKFLESTNCQKLKFRES